MFYVTADPYTAMQTTNFADVSSASDVTSANTGGLESNGRLAQAIAKRNLKRQKENSAKNKQKLQPAYHKTDMPALVSFSDSSTLTLDSYLPDTGMYGTETANISSPTDLLGITNATEVFSVDYYEGATRLSAVLATATQGSVYDHSKVICEGHLYILQTPLFRVRNKKETIYCYSESERREALQKLGSKPEITRFKGLGEISPDEFKHFIGDDIRLDQVMLDKSKSIDEFLKFYMGKNTPDRQEFIIDNLRLEIDLVEELEKELAE